MTTTAQQVQDKCISILRRAAQSVGARLVLADDCRTRRPTLWLIGTPDQKRQAIRAAKAGGVAFADRKQRRLIPLFRDFGTPVTVTAYLPHTRDGVMIHGPLSGIRLELPGYGETGQTWRAATGGVESEVRADMLDDLPIDHSYGVPLPQLRNAAGLRRIHPARSPIDIVYTWVDGSDPVWQARKAGVPLTEQIRSANADTRFRSDRELLYSIRSVLQFFKGHSCIHVVTDNQVPLFLGDLLDRVTIVDHRDIFPNEDHLPTYNSHAIGAYLHRIPGLSEHYLYLNDDVIFGRTVSAAMFFDEYGRSRCFPSNVAALPSTKLADPESPVDAAGRNNRDLLQQRFGVYHYRKYWHAPVATSRRVMEQMERDLPEAWARTVPNRIRSPQDHSIAGNLYFGYAAAVGRAVDGTARYRYLDVGAKDFLSKLDRICTAPDRSRPDFFCLNETLATEHTDANKRGMADALERLLPQGDGAAVTARRPFLRDALRRLRLQPGR